MTLELTESQAKIKEWAERFSGTSYGEEKNFKTAQRVIDDWKNASKSTDSSEKNKKQVSKVLSSIDYSNDVLERNLNYRETMKLEVERAKNFSELDSINESIDKEYLPQTKAVISRSIKSRRLEVEGREEAGGESIEELQNRTRASLRIFGLTEDEIISIKEEGIKPETL